MPNPENLRTLSSSEARKLGSAGGRASGEARRRKRAMREVLDDLLQMPLKQGDLKNIEYLSDLMSANGKINLLNNTKVNVTVEQAVLLGQVVLAMQGNTKAATFLRDTAGQKILKDADAQTEYEDDGFTDAIKRSAKDVWK
ncbi:MAG: hypothetical protein SPI35_08015 [Porphyromonas sp.]|nr:hypothetical protein [Porphyromonas sp.]